MRITLDEKQKEALQLTFGNGKLVPEFIGAGMENGTAFVRWEVTELDNAQPVGSMVKSFSKGHVVARFEMDRDELKEFRSMLISLQEVNSRLGGGIVLESTEDTETPQVMVAFEDDSPLAIMVVLSVIDQSIVALDMTDQADQYIHGLAKKVTDLTKQVNHLKHDIEYSNLRSDDKDYDKAIADLVKYREIFPPNEYPFEKLQAMKDFVGNMETKAKAFMDELMGDL